MENTRAVQLPRPQGNDHGPTTIPFLLAIRRSPVASSSATGELILIRHGQTVWSRDHRHTGRTDVPLTAAGEAAAAALAGELAARHIVAAFASPAQRAVRTAEL